MPIPILMPALSPTMEEGTLSKWLVKEGDQVAPGDVIAEIETDKATMEVEAVDEGRVGRLLVGEGTEGVAVNNPIAVLLEEGEGEEALKDFEAGGAAKAGSPPPEQPAKPEGGNGREAPPQPEASQQQPAPKTAEDRQAAAPAARPKGNGAGRTFVSPLARRMAEQHKLDLARLQGSGPHGRIIKRDIEAALEKGAPEAAEAAPAEEAPAGRGEVMRWSAEASVPSALSDEQILALYDEGSYELVPHGNMRRVIAQRLSQATRTIPHFYLNVDCELDALLAARARINAMSPDDGANNAFKLSVNDFVIKAMAMALQKVPDANATWTERGLLRHRSSDIGVAVAVEGGLFTPVIRHAEVKSLSEISNEMHDLAQRARTRRLKPHEYQGGTTAISNLGMYGVKSFDAVINPPHATILAVGMGEKRPVVKGDELKIATVMSCTLSCDHRVVDGALGAELLAAFKGFIEEPVTMLV